MEKTCGAVLMIGVFVALANSQPDVEKKEGLLDEMVLSRASSFSRAGSTVSDWCAPAFNVPCRGSGTECKSGAPVADLVNSASNTQGHTEFCVCKNGYVKYISGFAGERCQAVASTDPNNAECEIDDDCSTYGAGGVAVCRLELNKLVGRCACGSSFIYDRTQSTCRPYDCSKDGDGKCREDRGPNGVCSSTPGSPGTCACKTGTMMLSDPSKGGQRQCRDLASYRCDNTSNLCPATGANPLNCDASGRCVCPKNTVVTVVPGSGLSECRSLSIGSIGCFGDKDCPENGACLRSGASGTGICLCKDYYKAIAPAGNSPVTRCQLAVGTCCKTGSDCGEMRNTTSIPLTCVRPTTGATPNQRGVCLCQGVGTTSWSVDKCSPATC